MVKKPQFDYDLIVIGSGAGGSTAALIAAEEGKRVALIEAGEFGGEAPNWSDIPSKTLLHIANLYDEARHGSRFGIRASMLGYNYPTIQRWKEAVIDRTGAGGNRRYYEKKNIDTFAGIAHFLSPNEVSVNRKHLSASNFVIATGSHTDEPAIFGRSGIRYLTTRTALQLHKPPRSVLIVGGTARGVEIAHLFATFGTKVYISDVSSRLLSTEDEEVGQLMERLLKEEKGVTTLTQTQIISLAKKGVGTQVGYLRGGVERTMYVDEVVIATKPIPTVDLGLENASVKYTPVGVGVNEFLQTSSKHIYAVGHVLGKDDPTHTSIAQGRVAVHNILHPKTKISPDYKATPRVVFIYPGVASVGLSEDDCLRRDLRINKAIAPLNIVARSNTSDFRDGFVKLITDKRGVLLGGTVVAPHAAEIIQEIALGVKYGMTARALAETPHAFLSWSEAVRVAAGKLV